MTLRMKFIKQHKLAQRLQDYGDYIKDLVSIRDGHSLNSLTDLEWESTKMLVNAYDGAELTDERLCHLFMLNMNITIPPPPSENFACHRMEMMQASHHGQINQ